VLFIEIPINKKLLENLRKNAGESPDAPRYDAEGKPTGAYGCAQRMAKKSATKLHNLINQKTQLRASMTKGIPKPKLDELERAAFDERQMREATEAATAASKATATAASTANIEKYATAAAANAIHTAAGKQKIVTQRRAMEERSKALGSAAIDDAAGKEFLKDLKKGGGQKKKDKGQK
jgi:hypothetical protein